MVDNTNKRRRSMRSLSINLKGVCNSTLAQNVVVASLVVLQNIIL